MITPKLSVLISTYRPEGIERVCAMNLPVVDGVDYVVSWQEHHDAPIPESLASRSDISVFRTDSHGLSNNRNNALEHATGDVILIADDDLTYTPQQLLDIIHAFDEHPEVDYASFRYKGATNKNYPNTISDLAHLPKGFYQSSIEISFRNNERTRHLRFNPLLGLGAPKLTSGEEELLLYKARKSGLKCMYFPIEITSHPHISTGEQQNVSDGFLNANGAVISVMHPWSFVARIPVNALRLKRAGRTGFFRAASRMFEGAIYAFTHSKIRNYAKPRNKQKSK